jgi:hypothetical protein
MNGYQDSDAGTVTLTATDADGMQSILSFELIANTYPINQVCYTDLGGCGNDGGAESTQENIYYSFSFFTKVFDTVWPAGTGQLISDDFNGDGKIDIAVTQYQSNPKLVIIQNGCIPNTICSESDFSIRVEYPTQAGETWMPASGDFNGDGKVDIAVAGFSQISLFKNTSSENISFEYIGSLSPGCCSKNIKSADLNNDGLKDLVVTGLVGGAKIYIQNSTAFSFDEILLEDTYSDAWGLEVYDLNNDNYPEIILRDIHSASIEIIPNNSNSTSYSRGNKITIPTPESGSGWSSGLSVYDANNDGFPDVLYAMPSGVSLLENQGNFEFKNHNIINYDGDLFSLLNILIDDFNNDGNEYIIIGDRNDNGSVYLLNDNFTSIRINDHIYGSGFFIKADLNNDECKEIISTTRYGEYPGSHINISSIGECSNDGGTDIPTYRLPDTGQTESYTSTFGEDSDYLIHPFAYRDNGDGTVTDLNTDLMWQQATSDSGMSWDSAGSHCTGLSLAGYSDWRLPAANELQSIVDYGESEPSIDITAFPGTQTSNYWTSITNVSVTSNAWLVSSSNGTVGSYGKSYSYYVRCVRGSSSPTSFTDNSDGTVTDNTTGLMWQQATSSSMMDWEAALTYCEGLSLANQSDWRLPNVKELGSIVDRSKYDPAIDTTAFPGTQFSYYWSSTTGVDITSDAWGVYFSNGRVSSYYSKSESYKSYSYYVRCVRGGN